MRYLVIGGSQRKNQVIGVRDIPTGRCPGEDRERLQIGIPFGWDLADGIVLGRFLATGANSGESSIDPVLVALQAHLHRSVRVVPGETGEIVHDRLLLDHSPEADLLDLGAGDSGRNGLLLSAGGARGQKGASARDTAANSRATRYPAVLIPLSFCARWGNSAL